MNEHENSLFAGNVTECMDIVVKNENRLMNTYHHQIHMETVAYDMQLDDNYFRKFAKTVAS